MICLGTAASIPPQELLRTEYLFTNDSYRRFIQAFCECPRASQPPSSWLLHGRIYPVPCRPPRCRTYSRSTGHRRPRFQAQAMGHRRRPSESGNFVQPFKSPQMSAASWRPKIPQAMPTRWWGCTKPPVLARCGPTFHFAALESNAGPFLSQVDVASTPFYLLGGEYGWSCTEETYCGD